MKQDTNFANKTGESNIDFLPRFYDFVTPVVNADAGTQPKDSTVDEDSSDDENLSEDQQVKKKQKREKVGFRDRKVLFGDTPSYTKHTYKTRFICF